MLISSTLPLQIHPYTKLIHTSTLATANTNEVDNNNTSFITLDSSLSIHSVSTEEISCRVYGMMGAVFNVVGN